MLMFGIIIFASVVFALILSACFAYGEPTVKRRRKRRVYKNSEF